MNILIRLFALVGAIVIISASASAQWPDQKDPRATRTPDGKVDLNGPTPRTPDGKPDLSGTYRNLTRGANEPRQALSLDVNVMAHVYAARIVVPAMLERGGGYLLQTASAAGLLTQLGSAPYSVTKHAALAFAEWLAITYGDAGLKVSVLAPQAVRTAMTAGVVDGGVAGVDGMLEPDQVADVVIDGLDAESFLILPHPEVREYFLRKASDYERWLNGMRRLQTRFGGAGTPT